MSIYKVIRENEEKENSEFLCYLEIAITDDEILVATIENTDIILSEGLDNMPNFTLKLDGNKYAFNLLPNEDNGIKNNHSSSRFKCLDKRGGLLSTRSIIFKNKDGALRAAASVYKKPNTRDKSVFETDRASDEHVRLVTAYINDNAEAVKDFIKGDIGYDEMKENIAEFNNLPNKDKLKMMKKVELVKE